tara:strand:- start:7076 stop:7690 length:615 start_codon:yes stop_codon:yes gene_type:complete
MQQNKITEILNAPLPKAAIEPHPSKSFLSTIKPIYVIERLNLAFGIGGWKYSTEVIEINEKHVVVKGTLEVKEHNIVLENYGGNDNRDRGDAYKGAATDALTKCASYIGVGADVYRGGKPAEKITTPEDEKKVRTDFEKRIQGKGVDFSAKHVNAWLKSIKMIAPTQTYRDLKLPQIEEFLTNWEAFTKQVNKQNESSQSKTTK